MLDRKALTAGSRPDIGNKIIMTSSNDFDGYEITQYLGMVWGTSMRSKDVFRDIGMGCRQLTGGELSSYTQLIDESRQKAVDRLLSMTRRIKANGVINFHFDTTESNSQGVAMITVWGTAVRLAPISDYVPTGALGNVFAELVDRSTPPKQTYEYAKLKIGDPQFVGIECPSCKTLYDITKSFGRIGVDLMPEVSDNQIACPKCQTVFSICELEASKP